jgi:hypothetical protein
MVSRTGPTKELVKRALNTVITLTVIAASAPAAIIIWAWFTLEEHKRYNKEHGK